MKQEVHLIGCTEYYLHVKGGGTALKKISLLFRLRKAVPRMMMCSG